MTVSVLHTADAWWVKTPYGAARIDTAATTTGQLLADRAAIEAAAAGADTVAVDSLKLVSPVTRPCRVVAQMTNFESHVRDAGMDPASVPLTFFRKASASINGPFDDIVKPEHVRLLDYEVEIGLVIGRAIPVGTSHFRREPRRVHRRTGRHQRCVGARHPASADPVLRGQVLSDVHPGRAGAGAAGCRRAQAIRRPAAAPER